MHSCLIKGPYEHKAPRRNTSLQSYDFAETLKSKTTFIRTFYRIKLSIIY